MSEQLERIKSLELALSNKQVRLSEVHAENQRLKYELGKNGRRRLTQAEQENAELRKRLKAASEYADRLVAELEGEK